MRQFKQLDGSAVYLKVMVLLIGINILISIVTMSVQASTGNNLLDNSYFNYAAMTAFQIANISVVAVHLRKRRQTLDFSLRNKIAAPVWPLAVLAAVVCLFGFYGAASAFQAMLDKIGFRGQTNIPFNGAGDIAMGIAVTVVLAPIGEELVYRGALLTGLRKAYPWWAAVLLSGLAFSFMHMSPQQTVYQFFLGCTCAFLVLCSGSLRPAVVVHASSNLIAVLLEITPMGDGFYAFVDSISPNAGITALWTIATALAATAAIFGLGVWIKRLTPARPPAVYEYEPDDPFKPQGGALGNNTDKIVYFLAFGIAAFMWIYVFITGILP